MFCGLIALSFNGLNINDALKTAFGKKRINDVGFNQTISANLLDFKYSVIINHKANSLSKLYNTIDAVQSLSKSFCRKIYIFHNSSYPLADDYPSRIDIESIRLPNRNALNYYYFPKNLRTKFLIWIDDDIIIDRKNDEALFDIFYSKILQDGKTEKIFSPFTTVITNSQDNTYHIGEYNSIIPKLMFISAKNIEIYNILSNIAESVSKNAIINGCADIWFNIAVSKFDSAIFNKIIFSNVSFSIDETAEKSSWPINDSCLNNLPKYEHSFLPDDQIIII